MLTSTHLRLPDVYSLLHHRSSLSSTRTVLLVSSLWKKFPTLHLLLLFTLHSKAPLLSLKFLCLISRYSCPCNHLNFLTYKASWNVKDRSSEWQARYTAGIILRLRSSNIDLRTYEPTLPLLLLFAVSCNLCGYQTMLPLATVNSPSFI